MFSFKKEHFLYLLLVGLFITNALLAELIGVKIFSLESTLGFDPVILDIFGSQLSFNLTSGVVIWPLVFLTTDVINEYFGKGGVKYVSYLTVGLVSLAFFVIFFVSRLSPADFWMSIHQIDDSGNSFDINYAFNKIYLQGLGIIVASLVAFWVGQFVDVYIFRCIKRITGEKRVWLRATGSTLISQLIDSFLVLFLAFYVLTPSNTQWTLAQVFSVGVVNYIYKFVIAVLLTPFIYFVHYAIDRYLGENLSKMLKKKAML